MQCSPCWERSSKWSCLLVGENSSPSKYCSLLIRFISVFLELREVSTFQCQSLLRMSMTLYSNTLKWKHFQWQNCQHLCNHFSSLIRTLRHQGPRCRVWPVDGQALWVVFSAFETPTPPAQAHQARPSARIFHQGSLHESLAQGKHCVRHMVMDPQ